MKKFFLFAALALLAGCDAKKSTPAQASEPTPQLTDVKEIMVYTGRKAEYSQPLFDLFEKESGIKVIVKPGKTAALAAMIIREGENTPADVFFAQDSSNLGALSTSHALLTLPKDTLDQVDARYRGPKGDWVGTSGRARVLVYNKKLVKAEELPKSILELAEPKWKGKLGWAPKNGSFQSHVTAMIKVLGAEKTAAWVKALKANEIQDFPKNTPIVKAVAEGKIAAGLVNHYYLYKVRKDMKEAVDAENHFFADGDAGMFINVSGVAIMKKSKKQAAALKLVNFLLSKQAQLEFKEKNYEYPLTSGLEAFGDLKALSEINPVKIDLGDLDQIEATQILLEANGAL